MHGRKTVASRTKKNREIKRRYELIGQEIN